MKKSVDNLLIKENVSNESVEAINKLINEEERKNNQAVEDIRNAIAVYQGQATLGKIINIVLHEGRKPLNYFKNQRDNLEYYHKNFCQIMMISMQIKCWKLQMVMIEMGIFLRDYLVGWILWHRRKEIHEKCFWQKKCLQM